MTATDKDIERIVHYATIGTEFEDSGLSADLRAEWDEIAGQVATMRSHGVIVAVSNELPEMDDSAIDTLYRQWTDEEWEGLYGEEGEEGDDDDVTLVSKAVGTQRFTLGPMYIPDRLDAHGEWTDPDELQKAVWDYVDSGDRRIRLQHDTEVVAGRWLEVMTWPYPVEVPLMRKDAGTRTVTFPANTAFLGVQWEPWAWELVEKGLLRGYSIGGKAERLLVDLPEAEDMDKAADIDLYETEPFDPPMDATLAEQVAVAVAEAMKSVSPVVNVVMPNPKSQRIERDADGNITRIVEE